MKFIKNLSLALLMAPLLVATALANNSNARAPQSLGIGERPPSPAATHDREGKEQEPKAPEIYKDYSADLEEEIRLTAEQMVLQAEQMHAQRATPLLPQQEAEQQLRDPYNLLMDNYRQSIDNTRRFNAQDNASINARDQKGMFAFCKNEQEMIYACIQQLGAGRQVYESPTIKTIANMEQALQQTPIKLLSGLEYSAATLQDILEPRGNIDNRGFTRLMYAAAQNQKEDVEALLAKGADVTLTTDLLDWMTDEHASINLRACFKYINRNNILSDDVRQNMEVQLPENMSMPAAIRLIYKERLCYLRSDGQQALPMAEFDTLSLSAIAGNHEIVDLLLQDMAQKLETSKMGDNAALLLLYRAAYKLIFYADLAECEDANPLFAALGIAEPKKEHYAAITRKLMRFYLKHWATNEEKILGDLGNLLNVAMQFGPTHITQAVAEEVLPSNMSFHSNVYLQNRSTDLVQKGRSGEKLAILFSLIAPPASGIVSLRNIMLPQAATNPDFLSRLQEYVREHQMLPTAMQILNSHLIPALSTIVRSYITRPEHQGVPPQVAQQILAISYEDARLAYQANLLVQMRQMQRDKEEKKNNK